MAYNIFFTGSFDIQQDIEANLSIKVDIYKKDYTGDPKPMIMSANPVIHEWQDDDPKAPIKGSTCTLSIINDGTVNLESFYSNEDNTFRIEVRRAETDEALFIGYIMQNDCRELQVDFAHEIVITATDNLGVLKDITLGEAAELYGTPITHTSVTISTILGGYIFYSLDSVVSSIKIGQNFTVTSGPYAGTYTCFDLQYDTILGWKIYVNTLLSNSGSSTIDIIWNEPVVLTDYIQLKQVVKLCLQATQLQLVSYNVISLIFPSGGADQRWLDDTYIKGNTFLQDNSWMSCYEVLEIIMSRFKASCFQAYGEWYIVRWGEIYFQSASIIPVTAMLGEKYNGDFDWITNKLYDDYSFELKINDIEFGLQKSIIRPSRYIREQFNYVQPANLLQNIDFTELGELLNQYTSGSNTIYEYGLLNWYDYDASTGPNPSRFIRIVKDTTSGNELERYVVVTGSTYDSSRSVQSSDIELNANDTIRYTFSYKTDVSQPGVVTNVFSVRIKDGTNTKYVHNDKTWQNTIGFSYQVLSGDNTNEWHTVTIESNPIPFDCILNVYLAECTSSASDETHYKDLSFEVINSVSGSTKIIGHEHIDTNTLSIKNVSDTEIKIDDSPRSSISGTLFLDTTTGLLRDKTTNWKYSTINTEEGKLGYLVTLEEMMQKWKVRSKYDGTIVKIWKGSLDNIYFISNFFIFSVLTGVNKRFVPGQLSIDYKHNSADLTLWEITTDTEEPDDVEDFYQFNYLYEKS